ncbi:hypothetical protein CR513_28080, partial [Mucuna pruriens]
MFRITLQGRYIPRICERILNLCMPQSVGTLFLLNFIVSLKFKEMPGMGIKFENEILELLLLNSLLESLETFKVSVTNLAP